MKNLSKTVLLAALAGIFLLSCGGKPEGDDKPDEIPQLEDDFRLLTDKDKYYPFDALFISVDGVGLTAPTFPVAFGDKTLIAARQEDGSFLIFVPDMPPGKYQIVMNILELRGSGEIEIIPLPTVNNPQAVLEELENEINSIIALLVEQPDEPDFTLDDDELELLGDIVNEFNTLFASLTNQEKILFVQYWNANPHLYQLDDVEVYSLLKSSSTSEIFNRGTKEFGLFLIKKILPITMSGTAVALLITIPDPTFVTKLMALAAGALLLKQLIEVKRAVLKYFDNTVVPVWDNIISPLGAMAKMNNDFDYIFYKGVPKDIDVTVTYRTICADDINTGDADLKTVVENLEKFQDAWGMVDDVVSSIKRLFGFKGGMGARPQRLQNIKDYKTETVVIDASQVDIIMSEVNVWCCCRHYVPNGAKMSIWWTTCGFDGQYDDFNDDHATFTLETYVEGKKLILEKYSAIIRYPVLHKISVSDIQPEIYYSQSPELTTYGSVVIQGNFINHVPEHITIRDRRLMAEGAEGMVFATPVVDGVDGDYRHTLSLPAGRYRVSPSARDTSLYVYRGDYIEFEVPRNTVN